MSDEVCRLFRETYSDTLSVEEFFLRPRESSRFCDEFRRHVFDFNLQDREILLCLKAPPPLG